MSNPFYVYSGAFLPGILARAEAEATEFTAVQQGFNLLAIQGVDSGVANAYVVTTKGGQDGIYTDGMLVEFKAVNANTGACTIAIDGGAVVGLTSPTGQSLAGGGITANTWYRAMYNSTYSAFVIVAPASQVITIGTISSAPPTNKVGLTAAGGVATAAVPIDATYALDQSIVPTWTGAHTFGNTVTFNSTVSFAGGLTLTGASGQYAATLDGNATSGHSYGLEVNAGTTAGDIAMIVNNQSGGTPYLTVQGAGSILAGNPTGGGQGAGTINAQGLYINGTNITSLGVVAANPGGTVGLAVVNGTATTYMRSDAAPPLSQAIAPTWTGVHVFQPSGAATPVTVDAPVNAQGLVVNGATNTGNSYLAEFITGQGSGFSSGVLIQGGTTSEDYGLVVNNAAGTINYFIVWGDGEITMAPQTSATNQSSSLFQVGYLDVPVVSATAINAVSFRSKYILASGNVTITDTSGTLFPIGATMMIRNTHGSAITIALSTGTLSWLPSGSGTRTLAAGSLATVVKTADSAWDIFGFGLT